LAAALLIVASAPSARAVEPSAAEQFHQDVEPILEAHCYDCHGYGSQEGSVTLDEFASDQEVLEGRDLWWRALKMLRAGMMPPVEGEPLSPEERATIEAWIKRGVFQIDPANPDPGRVTVRRLNRVEYRNTIRDLMGVNYDVDSEFPPDDTGHGFDNLGDVLTISPLLLEKYIKAAEEIVAQAVPTTSTVISERRLPGGRFRRAGETGEVDRDALSFSYYEAASASTTINVEHAGQYQLQLRLKANEVWQNDESDFNRCRLVFKIDGVKAISEEFSRQEGKAYKFDVEHEWEAGEHELSLEVEPLTPNEKQVRSLSLRIEAATLRGPIDEAHRVRPRNYERFFPRVPPEDADGRLAYAGELLEAFASRAFRRPCDEETAQRLAALAESIYSQPGATFEAGVAQAMAAVLASPRFLFREEGFEVDLEGKYPLVDEYALASRLSYFLWSSMPDDELFRLASEGKLRENLEAQFERMLSDRKSATFVEQFAGQWLRSRDVPNAIVDARAVMSRQAPPDNDFENLRRRFRRLSRRDPETLTDEERRELRRVRESFFSRFGRFREFELTGELRRAMRRETEMHFEHIVRKDRSLLELIDADYAFLNEDLAKHYGIEGVRGDRMRRVELPEESPRGGVLTQGTTLVVTSNPDRTSPAKRGLYVLDNILGIPPPPPPPNIPSLEQAEAEITDHPPTVRESLERHRADPLCASCHNRMDPLGLALENFNALGLWRDKEREQPIDATGTLITGEEFSGIGELKQVLVENHRQEFYRCATEKMLTYALGRGLDYYDVEAVDQIVERIEEADGRASALMLGIIESAPFQRMRSPRAGDEELTQTQMGP
jgi:hypothetical protein